MEVTLEAIIAIIALMVALPPTVCIILGWLRRRRQRKHLTQELADSELALIPRGRPGPGGPIYIPGSRPHRVINATLSLELGDGSGRMYHSD
ncbi:hypothetical protein QBC47DRAFT_379175 [Echria macrotheca]|uniref:Uncharacterized protein n=1 Tax=Echria macrotheca TaxID=438768 RepID=A0AAJ0BD63_9PEZI|nr:hypothetical protein QBC47DRAFT_379175 [Echria macrotheca]